VEDLKRNDLQLHGIQTGVYADILLLYLRSP